VLVARLQTGALAGQLALAVQAQVLLTVLQLGLAPVHALPLVAEHCSQRPPTHAGSADVGQERVALEPLSPLHVWQRLAAVLQTGWSTGQLSLALQPHV
jgi:hypothetical protein